MDKIEQAVFASTAVGIESLYSGGGYYSYSKQMEQLKDEIGMKMNGYITEINFGEMLSVSDYIKKMPIKFAYDNREYNNQNIFLLSKIKAEKDFGATDEYAQNRTGSKLSHIIAGDFDYIDTYPAEYYDCNVFSSMPYTEADFSSKIQPQYMDAIDNISPGKSISKVQVIQELGDTAENRKHLKNLLYLLLHTRENANMNKKLVICSQPEKILYWIAALEYLLPVSYVRRISFSTYEYDPESKKSDFRILGVYPRGTAFDEIQENSQLLMYNILNQQADYCNGNTIYEDLVSSFFGDPKHTELLTFHKFLKDFDYEEVGVELESIYQLYLLLSKKITFQSFVGNWKDVVLFSEKCYAEGIREKIDQCMLYCYAKMPEYEEDTGEYLKNALEKGRINRQEAVYYFATDIINKIMPGQVTSLDDIRSRQVKYTRLFQCVKENFVTALANEIINRRQEILINNTSYVNNLYIVEVILNTVLVKKMDKECLFGNEVVALVVKQSVCNMMYAAIEIEKKSEYYHKILGRFQNEPDIYLRLLSDWDAITTQYNNLEAKEVFRTIKKEYIHQYQGNRLQLFDALYKLGDIKLIADLVINQQHLRENFDKTYEEMIYIFTMYPVMDLYKKDCERCLYTTVKNQDDMLKIYYQNLGESIWDENFIEKISINIINELPLIPRDDKQIKFAYQIIRKYGRDLTEAFSLTSRFLQLEELLDDDIFINDLMHGNYTFFTGSKLRKPNHVNLVQLQEYVREMVQIYLVLVEKTQDTAVLVYGADIIDDNLCREMFQKELIQAILSSKRSIKEVFISGRNKKMDSAELLINFVIYYQSIKNCTISITQMKEQIAGSGIKAAKLEETILEKISDCVTRFNKTNREKKILREEEIMKYWKQVFDNLSKEKKTNKLFELFGKKG